MTTPGMELTLLHVHSKSMGYGRYGMSLYEALSRYGVDMYDQMATAPADPVAGPPMTNDQTTPADIDLDRLVKTQFVGRDMATHPTNTIAWVSVPTHARGWHTGQYTVISTMWESAKLPEMFRETLHEFDQVIVPSRQNLDLFSEYHPNVAYVPLGIDPTVWHYSPRDDYTRFFRFLVAGSGGRKGTDLAHRAFKTVFRNARLKVGQPIPVLVMKNPRGEQTYYANNGQVYNFHTPDVEMVSSKLSAEDEVGLYESVHCYLAPTRGEGFGLQPLQALAQGIPTILTDAHGQAGYSYMGIPISATLSKSDYFMFGDAGEWWEPNFDELCEAMWDVYRNYPSHQARAESAALMDIPTNWTWDVVARDFALAIGHDNLTSPYVGDGSWYVPTANLYRIITDEDYHGEIAGKSFLFKAGVEYWEIADVKRILFEAGKLDVACVIGENTGLAPAQVDRLGLYQASKEYCPTCHQRMNSVPTKADDIMAGVIDG